MASRWKIKFGNMFGRYKAEGRSGWKLTSPTVLRETAEGYLDLIGNYDPPGTGWIAAGLSVVTFIIVFAVAQETGFAVGPGWLVWYFLIRAMRRESVTLDLGNADLVMLDDEKHRMAFQVRHNDRDRWMVFQVENNYGDAADCVHDIYGSEVVEGRIEDPSKVPFLIVLGITLTIVTTVVSMIIVLANQS